MYEEALAGLMPGRDLAQFVDTLNLRTQNLLAADRLASVIHPEDATSATLESRLNESFRVPSDLQGNLFEGEVEP